MRTTTLLIAVLLLVSACAAPRQFVRQDTDQARQKKDLGECEYEAAKATAAIVNPWDQAARKYDVRRQCMEVKGYVLR